jgi:thiazolylpeptide-type bacteriocin precursor
MADRSSLATLADEVLELEFETFEISDYSDAALAVVGGSWSQTVRSR